MVKNAELLSAIKAAGEAAIRLHEDNERLRGLLREAREPVHHYVVTLSPAGWADRWKDVLERIDAAIGENMAADQPGACLATTVNGGPLTRCDQYPNCPCGGPADNSSATAQAAAEPALGSTAAKP